MYPEVIIIGGGLAGLVSSLHLAKAGVKVLLIEKKDYPRHKVCGEYISFEVLPYLQSLEVDPNILNPKYLKRFQLSAPNGQLVESSLPLGGFSVSRYALDNFLYQHTRERGVSCILNTSVQEVEFTNESFRVTCSNGQVYTSKIVIGSFGKRSNLDKSLNRTFFQKQAPYVGIKYHIKYDYPEDLVALHNFEGGYCGLSVVETGAVNLCYLVKTSQLKKFGTIPELEQNVLVKNPHLKAILSQGTSLFKAPLVISNVSFQPKKSIHQHILMAGDSAGLISPLCGNGMAMAIHAAKIASEEVLVFFAGQTNRKEMEEAYQKRWKKAFRWRLWAGRHFQTLFGQSQFSSLGLWGLQQLPAALPFFIRQTHGSSIT